MNKRTTPLPTLFFDRDGTLIREEHYLNDPLKVKFLPGVLAGLRRLKREGFHLVVTSNQSGVARGLITSEQLEAVRRYFFKMLARHKTAIDGYYWCPHAPTAGCRCRKPRSGMLRKASRELGIPWRGGISVGDRPSDVHLAQKAGGWGVLVLSGHGRTFMRNWEGQKPDFIGKNFKAVVDWIMTGKRKDGIWTISEH